MLLFRHIYKQFSLGVFICFRICSPLSDACMCCLVFSFLGPLSSSSFSCFSSMSSCLHSLLCSSSLSLYSPLPFLSSHRSTIRDGFCEPFFDPTWTRDLHSHSVQYTVSTESSAYGSQCSPPMFPTSSAQLFWLSSFRSLTAAPYVLLHIAGRSSLDQLSGSRNLCAMDGNVEPLANELVMLVGHAPTNNNRPLSEWFSHREAPSHSLIQSSIKASLNGVDMDKRQKPRQPRSESGMKMLPQLSHTWMLKSWNQKSTEVMDQSPGRGLPWRSMKYSHTARHQPALPHASPTKIRCFILKVRTLSLQVDDCHHVQWMAAINALGDYDPLLTSANHGEPSLLTITNNHSAPISCYPVSSTVVTSRIVAPTYTITNYHVSLAYCPATSTNPY